MVPHNQHIHQLNQFAATQFYTIFNYIWLWDPKIFFRPTPFPIVDGLPIGLLRTILRVTPSTACSPSQGLCLNLFTDVHPVQHDTTGSLEPLWQ